MSKRTTTTHFLTKNILLAIMIAITVPMANILANTKLTTQQTIAGANIYALPNRPGTVLTQISVNPKSLANNVTDNKAIMQQIVVIACGAGTCHFARPRYGLGFYQAQFTFSRAISRQHKRTFKLLIVACSKLGCSKKQFNRRIIFRRKSQ